MAESGSIGILADPAIARISAVIAPVSIVYIGRSIGAAVRLHRKARIGQRKFLQRVTRECEKHIHSRTGARRSTRSYIECHEIVSSPIPFSNKAIHTHKKHLRRIRTLQLQIHLPTIGKTVRKRIRYTASPRVVVTTIGISTRHGGPVIGHVGHTGLESQEKKRNKRYLDSSIDCDIDVERFADTR